jgi:outer membrane receptor protein involved in Fe transport
MFESDTYGNSSNSPRASINYHFTPQQTLRFGMSTASRMPQMSEIYLATGILGLNFTPPISPIKPEQIFSREIAYLGEFPEANLTLDARVYYDQVRDLVWLDFIANGSQNSYKNLISANYQGVESTLKYRWNEGRSFLLANYAYQQASATLSADPSQAFNPMGPFYGFPSVGDFIQQGYQASFIQPYSEIVPKHSLSLLVSQPLTNSIQLSAGFYFRTMVRVSDVATDWQPAFDGIPPESVMRRLDLRLAKSFGHQDQAGGGEVAVVLQNASQDSYNMYGTVIQRATLTFSRRAYLTASMNY